MRTADSFAIRLRRNESCDTGARAERKISSEGESKGSLLETLTLSYFVFAQRALPLDLSAD